MKGSKEDSYEAAMELQHEVRETRSKKEVRILQLIVFSLGDEEFGAEISQVREVIRTGTVTSIPDSPRFIKGVSNVRGVITVVIDLKERFFLPATTEAEGKHIVITEQEKNLFGLMVDEVTEVLRISESEIKPTPELVTRMDQTYISGVVTVGRRLIILLDLSKVLSEKELARLTDITTRHHTAERMEDRSTEDEATQPTEKTERAVEGVEESV